MSVDTKQFSCIILAGGEGKRAGGADKGLILYKNKPLIEHVINAVRHQVDDIIISANRNTESYTKYTSKVITDESLEYRGPLAGIAACLPHCKHQHALIVACDMPALPADLIDRLAADIHNNSITIATVADHHQLAMIVKTDLIDSINHQLSKNQLKLIQWVKSEKYSPISFDDIPEAFVNLNDLADTLT